MKRLLLYLLTFQILTAGTGLAEALHVPYLIQHFQAHRATNPTLSLQDFLREHFLEVRHPRTASSQHRNEHQKLPFQHAVLLVAGAYLLLPSGLLPAPSVRLQALRGPAIFPAAARLTGFVSGIMHPPLAC